MQSDLKSKVHTTSASEVTKILFLDDHAGLQSEQEVFALLAEKKEVDEIARILGKKEKTVQNQKSIIYQKLNIRDRLDLIEFAKNIGVLF